MALLFFQTSFAVQCAACLGQAPALDFVAPGLGAWSGVNLPNSEADPNTGGSPRTPRSFRLALPSGQRTFEESGQSCDPLLPSVVSEGVSIVYVYRAHSRKIHPNLLASQGRTQWPSFETSRDKRRRGFHNISSGRCNDDSSFGPSACMHFSLFNPTSFSCDERLSKSSPDPRPDSRPKPFSKSLPFKNSKPNNSRRDQRCEPSNDALGPLCTAHLHALHNLSQPRYRNTGNGAASTPSQ